jgi:NADH-quinone oxidoreductase subunit L
MNTNLALLLLLAPFIGFLFNVFGKSIGNQLLESLEPCCFHFFFLASAYFFGITSNPAGIKFHFSIGFKSAISR